MPILKTCSKCKKDLPIKRFYKSPNYHDGKHPHCCYCRQAYRLIRLSKFPLCIHCKQEPHRPNSSYCFHCQRAMDKRKIGAPKRRYDPSNKTLCSRCKSAPRSSGHNYCTACRRTAVNEWVKRQGGSWAYMSSDPIRNMKRLARVLLYTAVKRGKIKRLPCEVCGNPDSEGHHYMGYQKKYALVVKWLCKRHHDEAERILKSLLTTQPLLL